MIKSIGSYRSELIKSHGGALACSIFINILLLLFISIAFPSDEKPNAEATSITVEQFVQQDINIPKFQKAKNSSPPSSLNLDLNAPSIDDFEVNEVVIDPGELITYSMSSGIGTNKSEPPQLFDGIALQAERVYSINELDLAPIVLVRPDYKLPASLIEAGMTDTTVIVNVVIDEQGKLELINFEHLPHPELEDTVKKIIHQLRFTPPKVKNKKVKSKFSLPLLLEGV